MLSHLHYDHLHVPSLRKLSGVVGLVAPRGAGPFLDRAGSGAVDELSPGETTKLGAPTVFAATAAHGPRRRPLRPRAQALGYLITGERSVYFAGDIDIFDGVADIGAVDLALLPVAGWSPKLGRGISIRSGRLGRPR